MPRRITDERVQEAIDYLEDSATEAAQARADRIYMTEYRKSLKSMLMKEFALESGIVQEREAYAHPKYLAHLTLLKEAVFHDEKYRFLREAKIALKDAYQTFSANVRGSLP